MKGTKTIIGMLNKVLTNELTAINQYFLHARMFGNWGFERLDEYNYKLVDPGDEGGRHADRPRPLPWRGCPTCRTWASC